MKPAIIVVDMLNDNVDRKNRIGIGEEVKKIIPNIQHLLSSAREVGIPIVFANDSFMPNDFLFQGERMRPHCIRGTYGAQVIDELPILESDMVMEKRRFSAFFKTDLDITLRELNVDTVVLAGIATEVCVLATALDGLSNDFRVIVLKDCCCSFTRANHEAISKIYQKMPIYPLLRVMAVYEFCSMALAGD
jgi:nicotinamidase-related amidase